MTMSRIMNRMQLLTVSLVLPFMAVSGVVRANATTARIRPVTPLSFSAHAQMRPETSGAYGLSESPEYRYLGGLKSRLFASQHEFALTHSGGR